MQVGVMVSSYNHDDWGRLLAGEYDQPPATPDVLMVDDALAMGELVEPLGFDSIWAPEHYGTAYSMQPNPLQWLAYWAGRTSRIDLGTAVIVAPWWNPVRLVHEIAMLDVLLGGRRLLLGLGRGIAEHEYRSLGVPRDKSREYFHEVLEILRLADTQDRFSYDGEIFQIPPTSVRPQPRHKGRLLEGVRGAFNTRRSAELAAAAGLGQIFVTGDSLDVMRENVDQFNQIRAEIDLPPDQPTVFLWMYCAETEELAEEGYAYFLAQGRDAKNHYFRWNSSGFDGVEGYEEYAAQEAPGADGAVPNAFLQRQTQLIGTPEQLIERVRNIQGQLDMGYLVLHVKYGGMPLDTAERSMRLFAAEVLPAIHAIDTSMAAPLDATTA